MAGSSRVRTELNVPAERVPGGEIQGQVGRSVGPVDVSPAFTPMPAFGNIVVGSTNRCVFVDASNGAVTILLPAMPQTLPVIVKKIDSSGNAVTVKSGGLPKIDGAASASLASQYASVFLVPFRGDWWKV